MTTPADAISTPLLIAGEERPGSAGTFPVYDPAHAGAIIGYAAAASRRRRARGRRRRRGGLARVGRDVRDRARRDRAQGA